MRKVIVLALAFCWTHFSFGQGPGGGQPRPQMNIGRFYGRIVDAMTGKGIDAASIQLFSSVFDTLTHTKKDTIISGMLTRKSGEFSMENLPIMGRYRLSITAIGYKTLEQPVSFDIKFAPGQDMSQVLANADKDLGNFKLSQDAQMLESVTVSADKPLMQMGIDRKIFNVEKNINSTGGTAVDIMRTIPALNVDIDGNVTLRNAAPQIFVDGRPTTLTLDQIPSDAIESVEMITNPSAKFDASSGQSGILNIVLKKAKKVGYNGGVRTGIDSRGRINAGGDINVRQGKVNVFASTFYNQRKSKSTGETDRQNLSTNPQTTTDQSNNSVNKGGFAFGRFGLDYFIDNRNTLTISQNIAGGKFNFNNKNNLIYQTLGSGGITSQYRNTLGYNKFHNYTTTLGYKHTFAKTGREFTADVNYNRTPNSGQQDIYIRSFDDISQRNPKTPEQLQNIINSGNNRFVVLQTDYVNPINANMKWEAGLRSQIRSFESSQFNFYDRVPQLNLNNQFTYSDYVYAGYATFSQKIKDNFSYQVGLRAESSSYSGEQQLSKTTYKNNFPLSLFPSVFLTKNIGSNQDLQLNYSRKINRPGFFQLMPSTDYSDTLNLQTGNPGLRPEFTHSLELSYMKTYGEKNNTFLATVFGKYTTDLIARYQTEKSFGDTMALVSSWINASTAYAGGLELIFRNTVTKWWEVNLNTNVYYSKINGSNVVAGLENERVSSFSKLNNTFRITKSWSVQFSGEYQSKSALPVSTSNNNSGGGGGGRNGFGGGPSSSSQGYINANYGADLGIRKEFKIKKNQATVSLNINDIFRTRKYAAHTESIAFIQDEWRRRDPQVARLNFSYRFGKFDVNLFKRKNNRSDTDTQAIEGQQ